MLQQAERAPEEDKEQISAADIPAAVELPRAADMSAPVLVPAVVPELGPPADAEPNNIVALAPSRTQPAAPPRLMAPEGANENAPLKSGPSILSGSAPALAEEAEKRLSQTDRNAFREIARALGARLADDMPEPPGSKRREIEAKNLEAAKSLEEAKPLEEARTLEATKSPEITDSPEIGESTESAGSHEAVRGPEGVPPVSMGTGEDGTPQPSGENLLHEELLHEAPRQHDEPTQDQRTQAQAVRSEPEDLPGVAMQPAEAETGPDAVPLEPGNALAADASGADEAETEAEGGLQTTLEAEATPGHAPELASDAAEDGETGLSDTAPVPAASAIIPADVQAAGPAALPVALGNVSEAIIDQLPIGILILSDGAAVFANQTLLDLLGYDDLGALQESGAAAALLGPSQAPDNAAIERRSLLLKDGSHLDVLAHAQPFTWRDRHAVLVSLRSASLPHPEPGEAAERAPVELASAAAPSLDLSLLESRAVDLQQRLKGVEAEREEFRAILDTATDGVISLDSEGRITGLNRSAEALFGVGQNEVAGQRFSVLLAGESHASAIDYLDGLKSGGVASVLNDGREVVGREKKGGRIQLFMTMGRISDRDSGRFCAVLRDLTAWKKAEAELLDSKRIAERASQMKSDFLAKISHEIRTPMNAIIGFSEVMRTEQFGPIGSERYREYLGDIHRSGEHVISLVNDLLDLSKIEAGRAELSFTSVNLNDIVAECVSMMQPQAARDRVIMRSNLAERMPHVVADERSIRQVVLNLLSNACKFNQPGGQVIVSTALSDHDEAVIRVRDTGIGMSEKDIEGAMQPFRQMSPTRRGGGTGLGLPLTKALIEANRASLTIKSAVTEGTLVEVIFPATRVLAE